MRKQLAIFSLGLAAAAMPLTAAVAAMGTPQRSTETPAGLLNALSKGALAKAILATEGSNSRLQEVPVSP
jgi:hypothetical protein